MEGGGAGVARINSSPEEGPIVQLTTDISRYRAGLFRGARLVEKEKDDKVDERRQRSIWLLPGGGSDLVEQGSQFGCNVPPLEVIVRKGKLWGIRELTGGSPGS